LDLPGLGKLQSVCGFPLSALAFPAPLSGLAPSTIFREAGFASVQFSAISLINECKKYMIKDEIDHFASDFPQGFFAES
jgi:hypothetical protein